MSKPAKPEYAYAIKRGGKIDITSIDEDRAALVRHMNRPCGESVIKIRISEVVDNKARIRTAAGPPLDLLKAVRGPARNFVAPKRS